LPKLQIHSVKVSPPEVSALPATLHITIIKERLPANPLTPFANHPI